MSPWQRLRRRAKALTMRFAPGMLTCAEFEAFVLDYHEGELNPRQRALFERHMSLCPPCRTSFDHYRRAVAIGRRLFEHVDDEAEAPADPRLVASILEARREG